MHAELEGDKATLFCECLWINGDNNAVGAHSFCNLKLARAYGPCVVKGIRVGKIETL